MELHKDLSSN